MTDEGVRGEPMDTVEVLNAMRNFAQGVRAFYLELLDQEFQPHEALQLASAWVAGTAGGRVS